MAIDMDLVNAAMIRQRSRRRHGARAGCQRGQREEDRARSGRLPEAHDHAAQEPGSDEAARSVAVRRAARAIQLRRRSQGDQHLDRGPHGFAARQPRARRRQHDRPHRGRRRQPGVSRRAERGPSRHRRRGHVPKGTTSLQLVVKDASGATIKTAALDHAVRPARFHAGTAPTTPARRSPPAPTRSNCSRTSRARPNP